MHQDSGTEAATGKRRFLHALRPLLMLAGFVVVWCCLATGTAQAAEEPHRDLSRATKALTGPAGRLLHAKPAPVKPGHVRGKVAPVEHTVRTAVGKTTVAPVVRTTTVVVRTHVEPAVAPVVEKVRAVLARTPVESSVVRHTDGSGVVRTALPQVAESSVVPGENVSAIGSERRTPVSLAQVPVQAADVPLQARTTLQGQDQAAPSSPISQGPDLNGLGVSGSTGTSSGQSGSDAGATAALLEGGLVIVPATDGTLHSAPAARLAAGPAFPPASSPD